MPSGSRKPNLAGTRAMSPSSRSLPPSRAFNPLREKAREAAGGKKRLSRRHGRSGGSVRVLFPSSLHTASSSGGLLPVDSPFGTPSRTRPCMHRIRIEFSVKKFHPQSFHGNPAAAKECEWILLRVSFSKSLSSLRPGSLTKDNLLDLH